ncbi:MAG: DUF302 domain-containing protein [bacterium]|nr:MAG: DUF302 domain-containing protein [bacterium]
MRLPAVIALALLTAFGPALASHGIVTVQSGFSVEETADRLEAVLERKGMTVFNRIDHAAAAGAIGQDLRPTVLIIFGNPKVGTALMQCSQTAGIDLPLKALVWRDADGLVKLSYNHPQFLADRHGIIACGDVIERMTGALKAITAEATQ